MGNSRLDEFISRYRRDINLQLTEYTRGWYAVEKLEEAVRHSLWGGKRMRPLLALMSAETVSPGIDLERLVPIAASVELVHIFTLVHDDLPGMDDAKMRHGRECAHVKYGEGVAILVGDALLNQAYGEILSARPSDLPDKIRLRIIGHLSRACADVVEGQVIDLSLEGEDVSVEELENLHRLKTASLLSACAKIGAELARGGDEDIERLDRYGIFLGLAYQVKDDLLSAKGVESEVGKTLSGDADREKATYPRILGVEESEKLLSHYTDRALESLTPYGDRAKLLAELAVWCRERTS